MTAPRPPGEQIEPYAPRAQWVGFFLAPAVFFAHLQLVYALVPWECARGSDLWIHVAGVTAMLLAALGAYVAWRVCMRVGRAATDEARGPRVRTRFVAVVGLGASLMFVLLLFAQWVAVFFISPCQ